MRLVFRCLALLTVVAITGHLAAPIASAAEEGAADYEANCGGCHSLEQGAHMFGPSLFEIMGDAAGAVAGYDFSVSYVEAGENGLVWTEQTLDAFLERPPTLLGQYAAPPIRNQMPVRVGNADVRRRVIAYLVSLNSGEPK